MQELVIRNGMVIDGTGLPRFLADVEIQDGRISRVGPGLDISSDAEIIDATGMLVTPGFIDIHTHYDAQLFFEPTASPSSWHGVTTVLVGNCGFALVPSAKGDVPWLLEMLSRVEGMPIQALRAGVDFTGGSVSDYLDRLTGAIGVNVGVFAGHCAIRRAVMGEAASERAATDDEIEAMRGMLRQAMLDGAAGFSTSQLDLHTDHLGRPVPENLATADELVALAAVLAEFDHGVIEFIVRSAFTGYSADDRQLLTRMCEASQKPIDLALLGRRGVGAERERWRDVFEFLLNERTRGNRLYPMYHVNPKGSYFSLIDTFMFDEVASLREVLVQPVPAAIEELSRPGVRDRIREEMGNGAQRTVQFDWARVGIVRSDRQPAANGTMLTEWADRTGSNPLDAMLDLAVGDSLTTTFLLERPVDPLEADVTREIMADVGAFVGSSDGGAHVQTFCGADFPTVLLTDHVPNDCSLETAIHRLTYQPALSHGIENRGVLRPGAAGDVLVIDPTALGAGAPRFMSDLPAGATRLVIESTGYRHVIVNGVRLYSDGQWTGALPGHTVRFGAAADDRTPVEHATA